MVGTQEPLPFGLVCPRHGGPEPVAWQPRVRRGQPRGDGVSAAALTGPPTAALTGRAAGHAGGRKQVRRAPRAAQRKPLPRLEREHGDQRPTTISR